MQQQARTSSCILLYFYLVVELNRLPSASRLKLHLVPGAGKLLGDFHPETSNHCQSPSEEQRWASPAGLLRGAQRLHLQAAAPRAKGTAQHLNHEPAAVTGDPAPSPTRSARLLSLHPGNQDLRTSIQNQAISGSEMPLLFDTWLEPLLASHHLLHKHLLTAARKMGVYY